MSGSDLQDRDKDELSEHEGDGLEEGEAREEVEEAGENEQEEEEEDEEDEEEESEDEDDEESEDEEEEEPKLKYTRITQLPTTFLKSDSISTCLIHDNFCAFATHGGFIHITRPDLSTIRTLRAHTASVLALSTDGFYLASASLDGTVVIGSIEDPKDVSRASFGRPVHSVALDPNYKSSKAFISGGSDSKLIFSERGWLGKRNDTVVKEYEDSMIIGAFWIAGLLIWFTDDGITIYSKSSMSPIAKIARPESVPRVDMYKPRLCSPESNRIYIAWVDMIWVLKVSIAKPKIPKIMSSASSAMSLSPEPKVEIEAMRQVEFMIGGIAPLHSSVLLLGCHPRTRGTKAKPPELKIYDIESGEEVYADELELKMFEQYGVNDYHLGFRSSKKDYFVVSAKDSVIARERDLEDRINWLVQRERYHEAWEIAGDIIDPDHRREIGIKWVKQLTESGQWSHAGHALVNVTQSSDAAVFKTVWEQWATTFIRNDKTEELADAPLPDNPEYKIQKNIYDTVLVYLLEHDRLKLLDRLENWAAELYTVSVLRAEIEDILGQEDDAKLRKALVKLSVTGGDPLSAVPHLLHLHDTSVVELVREYHLLPSVKKELPAIMTVSLSDDDLKHAPVDIIRDRTADAVKLVVDGRHQVLPQDVLDHIKAPELQVIAFLYLEQLNSIDSFLCKDFGDLQIKLYAEFDRPKLISFIRKNNNYNIGNAVDVCERNNYTAELVYLLGKVGQNKRALKLIIEKLQNPHQAIEFAKAQNDRELWNDLIEYSMDRPEFVSMLLTNAGSSVDPIDIIRKMSEKLEIPDLKRIMVDVFHEKDLVLSISQGVLDIIKVESLEYSTKLRESRLKGNVIDFEKHPDLDPEQSVVLTPQGELKTEAELLGSEELVWSKQRSRAAKQQQHAPSWSVARKVTHLGYILSYLNA